jgi:hypothetical protein
VNLNAATLVANSQGAQTCVSWSIDEAAGQFVVTFAGANRAPVRVTSNRNGQLPFPDNVPHHLAVIISSIDAQNTKVSFFVDGQKYGGDVTVRTAALATCAQGSTQLGANIDGWFGFAKSIDRSLTTQEVGTLFFI